jgi:hypothetical protein
LRKLSALFLCLALSSCGGGNETFSSNPAEVRSLTLAAEAVRFRKDPKGGWFGPKLQDIYVSGQGDTPQVFCGSGPSVPTGEQVTLFFVYKESTPQSSQCWQILKIVKGEAEWDAAAGKIVLRQDVEAAMELQTDSRHKMSAPHQIVSDQAIPPADLEPQNTSAEQISRDSWFKAYGHGGKYRFTWGRALHELGEPPQYSLGKFDDSADPDSELQTTRLETYLLESSNPTETLSRIEDPFIFNFGEYETLNAEQKATVQGFCSERMRILTKAWPDVAPRYWKQGGWYESTVFSPSGNFSRNQLKSVCE